MGQTGTTDRIDLNCDRKEHERTMVVQTTHRAGPTRRIYDAFNAFHPSGRKLGTLSQLAEGLDHPRLEQHVWPPPSKKPAQSPVRYVHQRALFLFVPQCPVSRELAARKRHRAEGLITTRAGMARNAFVAGQCRRSRVQALHQQSAAHMASKDPTEIGQRP
jgi:hypothetical protein